MAKNNIYVAGAEYPYQYKYEHMAVTTDCVMFTYEDRQLKVLLIRRGVDPYKGEWALPGGFLKITETAEQGALRELWEETALSVSTIHELGVFSDPDRDPRERVITIAFYALVKPSEVYGGDDAEDARWFPIGELPTLAFDHQDILNAALKRLRRDIHFEPVGFNLLDDTFTIPDLQRLYEIILGKEFDRRNFQRKVLASGILEEVARPHYDANVCCEMAPPPRIREQRIMYQRLAEPDPAPSGPEKKRPGRTPDLFRLIPEKYKEMKDEGDKFEF